ncbi:Cationic amino acid transporter [Thalictrum thalictroides]|uniref:Cationic amino acid transporter n=1 Tax=Thalictrum thalictroides TaxID=46969 RepID=A0A7J6WKW3_THATH|nr:Cationic amino acid transporter [Thalictrum thalictroides]
MNEKNRGCCSKDDFLPEESFKSWGNYFNALKETKLRLKDRFFARSQADEEINQICARSKNEMRKSLTWWDLIWFGIGSVMGAGIFVLTGLEARQEAGPAVVLAFLVSGISAMLSVFCYTEFAVEIPVAGGSFAYVRVELGDFVAFIAAGNILFEYVVSGASVARSWTSYFATLCNHNPDDFRILVSRLPENYNHLDPLAVLISFIVAAGAILSTKGSSRFNSIASILHIFIVVFIIIAGLTKANPANFTENFAPFGARGVFTASAVLFFAYIGFDGVATLAEETKNPARDIPIGLIGSMSITITVYCLLAVTLCLMQSYTNIDINAPYSVAFQAVGMSWAKYIVSIGAVKAMTTVLLGNIIGQARYFTHIARTHMAPPWLAIINEKTGTPMNATIIMTLANCIIGLFTDLSVLSNLLSISTLSIFSLVALALLVRRYYVFGETPDSERNKLIGFLTLIIGSSVATAAYWGVSKNGWIGFVVTVSIWFLATLGLKLMVKEARKPKLWGTPLMPWLPSATIAFNIFLLGSIDAASFIRFTVWSVVLLIYYFLVGLHASYDTAKEASQEKDIVDANA